MFSAFVACTHAHKTHFTFCFKVFSFLSSSSFVFFTLPSAVFPLSLNFFLQRPKSLRQFFPLSSLKCISFVFFFCLLLPSFDKWTAVHSCNEDNASAYRTWTAHDSDSDCHRWIDECLFSLLFSTFLAFFGSAVRNTTISMQCQFQKMFGDSLFVPFSSSFAFLFNALPVASVRDENQLTSTSTSNVAFCVHRSMDFFCLFIIESFWFAIRSNSVDMHAVVSFVSFYNSNMHRTATNKYDTMKRNEYNSNANCSSNEHQVSRWRHFAAKDANCVCILCEIALHSLSSDVVFVAVVCWCLFECFVVARQMTKSNRISHSSLHVFTVTRRSEVTSTVRIRNPSKAENWNETKEKTQKVTTRNEQNGMCDWW